jgi:predicted phage terminase large subunit-like protein
MQSKGNLESAIDLKHDLLSSFFYFNQYFYKLRTNRDFLVSKPDGNESHFFTIARELVDVFRGKTTRLMINVPPGWGKSTICQSFIAWAFAHYGDCRFLYISHSFELAASHNHTVKKILQLPEYKTLFGIELRRDQSAKDFFETTSGGACAAFGAKGSIVGRDAGLPMQNRFSGALLIDDIHKPDEVHSDTIRDKVKKNYFETIEMRLRDYTVPIIFIGQRLHEDDLPSHLLGGADGQIWRHVSIKGMDDAGNARYPEVMPLQKLNIMKEKQPYVFASQIQQNPIPAGGALFKEEWFEELDEEPKILSTFITLDGAETEKKYNDATAMSFWGVYKLNHVGHDLDLYGLHWLNCWEQWVEPKDIEEMFMDFYTDCLKHPVKPKCTAIEKKSTGTVLVSVLKKRQGLNVIDIERNASHGSKADRFLQMQPYVASRQITFPSYAKHKAMCIKHMTSITANNTHARDDICDTAYDAIDLTFIRKLIINQVKDNQSSKDAARMYTMQQQKLNQARERAYYGSNQTWQST